MVRIDTNMMQRATGVKLSVSARFQRIEALIEERNSTGSPEVSCAINREIARLKADVLVPDGAHSNSSKAR